MPLEKYEVYLRSSIRKIWRWCSKERRECLRAKKCCKCGKERKLYADHINPVVDPKKGFQGWDEYVDRMMNGKLMALCRECHATKTRAEGKERRETRKRAKPIGLIMMVIMNRATVGGQQPLNKGIIAKTHPKGTINERTHCS